MRLLKTSRNAQAKVRALIPHQNGSETARNAGMTEDKLNRWLNGTGHIFIDELWRLALTLGVSMEYLCDDSQTRCVQAPEAARLTFRPARDVTAPRKPRKSKSGRHPVNE